MSLFRCPICEEKIGVLQKCHQSICDKGIIQCPSCKNKLRLKKYGSSMANATLVTVVSYWVLGEGGPNWFLHVFLWLILILAQKVLSPILPYNPEKSPKFSKLAIVTLWTIAVITLSIYIIIGFVF